MNLRAESGSSMPAGTVEAPVGTGGVPYPQVSPVRGGETKYAPAAATEQGGLCGGSDFGTL